MHNRLPFNKSKHGSHVNRDNPPAHSCSCACKPKLIYAAELNDEFTSLLPSLTQYGEMICFARNQHCILGASLCMPEINDQQGYFRGGNHQVDLHWDTHPWRYAYTVHEEHKDRGVFIGMEFYDADHRALCRTFLTPESEHLAYHRQIQNYVKRTVHEDELSSWYRMGDLTPEYQTAFNLISDSFTEMDRASGSIASWEEGLAMNEEGFSNDPSLAYRLLKEATENGQSFTLTTSGAFGRLSLPFTPRITELGANGWMYAGGVSRALRLNLNAVYSYWIGVCFDGCDYCSYVEAVDAYGDLILRITSTNFELYQEWQELARAS
ncbi:MAG: ChuX/HutX family heme-like substrate-binding protein [Verrucomicrobiota bacterium]